MFINFIRIVHNFSKYTFFKLSKSLLKIFWCFIFSVNLSTKKERKILFDKENTNTGFNHKKFSTLIKKKYYIKKVQKIQFFSKKIIFQIKFSLKKKSIQKILAKKIEKDFYYRKNIN